MANSNCIPPEIQSSATAALFSCRKVFLLEELERAERLYLIHKGYIDALITELGADRYYRYAQARAETRDKLRSLRKSPSDTLNGLTAEREARIGILAESWQLTTSLGIDCEKIQEVQRTYSERAHAELQALSLSSADIRGPSVVAVRTPNVLPMSTPWFFSGVTNIFKEGSLNALISTIGANANHLSGNLDIKSEIHIVDPEQIGYAYLRVEAAIAGILRLPSAGKLFIAFDLDAREVTAAGNLSNLWGVSDLKARIDISSFARLYPVSGIEDRMGGWKVFDTGHIVLDGAEFWSDIRFSPGARKSFSFVSSQAYPAGTVMMLILGTGLFHSVWADDVTIESDIVSNWSISGIQLGLEVTK